METNTAVAQTIDFIPTQNKQTRVCLMDSKGNALFNRLVPTDMLTSFGMLKAYLQDNDNRPLSFWENLEAKNVTPGTAPTNLIADRDELKTGTLDGEEALVIYTKQKDKRINSGSLRDDIVAKMKELKLEAKVKEECGKNWTQVSNDKIQEVINKYGNQTEVKTEVKTEEKTVIDLSEKEEKKEDTTKTIINETVENSKVVEATKQVIEDMATVVKNVNAINQAFDILRKIALKYDNTQPTQKKEVNLSQKLADLNPFK
jgi:hypothetical protein